MEANIITRLGCKLVVLFDGPTYFFYNDYYGLLAVAKRDEQDDDRFTVYTGNHHCMGGRFSNNTVRGIVRRFGTQAENKYVTKEVAFAYEDHDLAYNRIGLEWIK